MRARKRSATVLLVLVALGCGGKGETSSGNGGSSSTSTGSKSGSGGAGGGSEGLPCDVADLVLRRCRNCHANPPIEKAPMSLVTYEDLVAKAVTVPSKTRAALAVERMKSASKPMPNPPSDPATADEIATMEKWVTAGLPHGDCIPKHGAYDGPPVCTTGESWTQGDATQPLPGELMHPGLPCVNCHIMKNAQDLTLGGTVFATAHEPDECDGANHGEVHITDAMGQMLTLPLNANGNFLLPTAMGKVAFPLKAWIVYQGRTSVFGNDIPNGDCNACHTQTGTMGAPGRLTLP